MSVKQRRKNRATATALRLKIKTNSVCPECGEMGAHWVQLPVTLEDLFTLPAVPKGFWVCDKFYGPGGRRIETRTSTESQVQALALISAAAKADGWTADAVLKGV